MGFLDNIEREYVLGDLQVFREFDVSQFIIYSNSDVLKRVDKLDVKTNLKHYEKMLQKAIDEFEDIYIDKDSITEFLTKFNKISKLDEANIFERDIEYVDVSSIKPQYLKQYKEMLFNTMDQIIKNSIDVKKVDELVYSNIIPTVEKQCVKTNAGVGLSSKDYIKMSSAKYTTVNTLYVRNKLLPFVSKFPTIKANALSEANDTLTAIKEIIPDIKAAVKVVEKRSDDDTLSDIQKSSLKKLTYNGIRGLIDIISYITYMQVRKLNSISSNIYTCERIYYDVQNLYSDERDLAMEGFDMSFLPTDVNSLTTELLRGNADIYDTLAKNMYEYHAQLPTVDIIDQMADAEDNDPNLELDQENYNKTVYKDIYNVYLVIKDGIDFINDHTTDQLIVYDDVLDRAGFSIPLKEKWRSQLSSIENLDNYAPIVNALDDKSIDHALINNMLAELKAYGNNMNDIAGEILAAKTSIEKLRDRLDNKTSQDFTDVSTIDELSKFLSHLDDEFTDFTVDVASKFMLRLRKISNAIAKSVTYNDGYYANRINTEPMYAQDFVDDAFESVVEEYVDETESIMKALQYYVYAEKIQDLTGGNVIFEAPADNQNTSSTTPTVNNGNQNNNQNTKPSVNEGNANNTSNNAQVTNQGPSDANLKQAISKVAEFIRKKIIEFSEYIDKQAKGTNGKIGGTQFLANNKDYLVNRSYNNVSVQLLPYSSVTTQSIIRDINKCTENINALKGKDLSSMTVQNVQPMVFAFLKGINYKEDLGTQFTKYYKVGTNNLENTTYSNGELKSEVTTKMIPYCESYLGKYKDQLKTAMENLANAADSLKTTGLNSKGNTPMQPASQPKNNQPNNGQVVTKESAEAYLEATNTNQETVSSWISSAVKYFTGAIMNASRDRYNDYMNVLSQLAKNNPANQAQPAQQQKPVQQNQNTEPTQNNQPDQNQGQVNQ